MKQGHRTLIWTIALLASMFVACGGNRPPVVQPPPVKAGTVHGVTLDAQSRAIAGVLVTEVETGRQSLHGGRTDGNGYWAFPDVTGDKHFRFEKNGWETTTRQLPIWDQQHRVHLTRVVPPHPAPLVGMLRVAGDGRSFQDNTGDVTPVSLHFGDGLWRYIHERGRVEEAMRLSAEAGYQVVRTWLNLNEQGAGGFWHYLRLGPYVTPNYRAHVVGFANLLKSNQLRWHMSLGGLKGYNTAQQEEFYRLIADVMREVGPEWFVLAGEVNEARDTTDSRDPREIERRVQIIRSQHPHNLYALSAFTGTEDRRVLREWTPSWMRFFIVHGYRHDHLWDKLRHRFSLLYEGEVVRRLAWETEAVGPGRWLSATQNSQELSHPEATPLLAALSTIARTIPTYTSSAGIIFDQPLTDMAGFRTTPGLVRTLSRDVMRWRLFHSGPGAGEDVRVLAAQGEVRIDGAADGNRREMVIYGPPGSYQLPIVRNFVGELCRTTVTVVKCDPVTLRAGERLSVSFTVGRLLVGRVQ